MSPSFVRQHIIDGEDADLIGSDLLKNKIFPINLEDCEIWDPLTEKNLVSYGDITEVSYLGDGKFLNSTLWISDFLNFSNPIYPEGIDIARYSNIEESLDTFMDNYIEYQINEMKKDGAILTHDYNKNNNKNITLGNETALKSEIITTRNDKSKTEEKFLMLKVNYYLDTNTLNKIKTNVSIVKFVEKKLLLIIN